MYYILPQGCLYDILFTSNTVITLHKFDFLHPFIFRNCIIIEMLWLSSWLSNTLYLHLLFDVLDVFKCSWQDSRNGRQESNIATDESELQGKFSLLISVYAGLIQEISHIDKPEDGQTGPKTSRDRMAEVVTVALEAVQHI